MKKAQYKCQDCNWSNSLNFDLSAKIPLSTKCPSCGKTAYRSFNSTSLSKESETVSAAIQTMLFSSLPSGKDKAVV